MSELQRLQLAVKNVYFEMCQSTGLEPFSHEGQPGSNPMFEEMLSGIALKLMDQLTEELDEIFDECRMECEQ